MDYGDILVCPITVPGTHLMIEHENPVELTDTYVALGCWGLVVNSEQSATTLVLQRNCRDLVHEATLCLSNDETGRLQ
jgi:hypothetical protein